jgi:ADP-heptose:LPS heptosyltransferase
MSSEIPPAYGAIIHPGAVGDCLLTLPLAAYMKKALHLDRLDFIGRKDYIDFYPGRTCIDRIRSLDSIQIHRLFEDESAFALEDKDRLMTAFEGYEQIVSFLGHGHPHFEGNLLFTVLSTHSGEVTLLPLAPDADDPRHVSYFYQAYLQQEQNLEETPLKTAEQILFPLASDYAAGQDLLEQAGVQANQPVVLIQPGSGSVKKSWHVQNFIQTASLLRARGLQTVFLLGPAEQERLGPDDLKQLGSRWPVLTSLSLTQVLQVLTQTELYLGNDSGISHLAAAIGQKTVVLFGPAGNPTHYRPLGLHVTVLRPADNSFNEPMTAEAEKVVQEITDRL